MKAHYFQPDPLGAASPEDPIACDLCGETADHPIHDMDLAQVKEQVREAIAEDFNPREYDFTPPDEPDSGFDVREPETVSDLFHGYGRDLP